MVLTYLLLFLLIQKIINSDGFHQTYHHHLSGTGMVDTPCYGHTGVYFNEYHESISIGGISELESFLLPESEELLVFFGYDVNSFWFLPGVWKYSLEKKQWKIIKIGNTNTPQTFENLDVFDKDIDPGARRSTKGWKNVNQIITFFGGLGFKNDENSNIYPETNEIIQYNINKYPIS